MTKLQDIQNICCLLLDEFARVCKQYNLSWFADSGTLLGAVRHGGFIPWDDDIDIVMPRKDYMKLIELGNSVFKHPYFLQTYKTDPNECTFNVQLRYTDSTKIRLFELCDFFRPNGKKFSSNKGIAIDICPLDCVPIENKQTDTISKFIKFLQHYCSARILTYTEYNKYLNVDDYVNAIKLYDATMLKINEVNKHSGYVGCTTWWGMSKYNGCKVRKKCYANYIESAFNGMTENVRVPVGYAEILEAYYGDWQTPVKGLSMHEVCGDALFDCKHSYKEYEQFTNTEICTMIQNNQTL